MHRILVVEDDPLISILMEDLLTELGCEVVGPARTVQDGLDLAGSPGLHGAILDVKLGDQNCFAIADALRERGVPFAFATGGGGVGDDSGFQNPLVLVKPFEFETVKAVVGKLLERQ